MGLVCVCEEGGGGGMEGFIELYVIIIIQFFVFAVAHVPIIPEEVLSHCVFQKELLEMADKPAILKHLKQQVTVTIIL